MDIYGPELGKGQISYPGSEVAEFTPTQKAALGGTQGFLDKFSPDAPYPMFGETGTALKGILGGKTGAKKITPEDTASFFKRSYEDPAMYQFSEYTRPLIREEYAGPGFWGSSRAKAVGKAGQELGQWLGAKRGEVEWQAGEANRAIDEAKAGRALSAVPLGLDYAGAPTREALTRLGGRQGVFNFASAEWQQKQNMLNDSIKKFQAGKRLTDPEIMNILMSLVTMGMSSSKSSSSGPGIGQQIGIGAGSLLTAGMLAPALGFTSAASPWAAGMAKSTNPWLAAAV
jgi:hypothetical protein